LPIIPSENQPNAKPELVVINKIDMKVFVIMPFSQEFEDIYSLGIKETAQNLGVEAFRLDEEIFNEGMLERIYNNIEKSDFIIADLSNKNPNVFYELGYAHANKKICILLTQNADNIPFDLQHKRHIVYNGSLKKLKQELEKNIKWAVETIEQNHWSPFEVSMKTGGYLENAEGFSEAFLNFTIEIDNILDKSAPSIEGLFLHSLQNWNIRQDGKKLSSRKSTEKPFNHKYSLTVDNPKIAAGGWLQIKLESSRIIRDIFSGDKIEETYSLGGNILIELVSTDGTLMKSIPVHIKLETTPF
jgi:hypothetical protein